MTTPEIVGIAASVLVAGAMMLSSILWLRRVSVLGNVSFMVYGTMISAWPVVATNTFICVTNIYYLILLSRTRRDFSLVSVRGGSDDWLQVFIERFRDDIAKKYPGFDVDEVRNAGSEIGGAFVLRNAAPVGVLLYRGEADGRARILLDYVIPGYRDFRIAPFLYEPSSAWLRERGVTELVVRPASEFWDGYFRRFGFQPAGDDLRMSIDSGAPS